jgi:large subunit ribosomal protein L11
LLATAAKIKKGSSTPNKLNVGSITKAQLEEIASTKLPDLNTSKLASAMKIVEGTARNMGISIVD